MARLLFLRSGPPGTWILVGKISLELLCPPKWGFGSALRVIFSLPLVMQRSRRVARMCRHSFLGFDMNVEIPSMLIFEYESVGLYRRLLRVRCCGTRWRKAHWSHYFRRNAAQ